MKNVFFKFFLIIFLFFSNIVLSKEDNKSKILQYLEGLKYFSASFIQNDGENLSEGKIYIGENRVRAEYFFPTKILIILDENKAMYYNYELEEDEFFNPKNTNAWFFYDVFRNPFFFEDAIFDIKDNELIVIKEGVDSKGIKYFIKTNFENSPLILRNVMVNINGEKLELSIFNHSYNEQFNKEFFKLINPQYLN